MSATCQYTTHRYRVSATCQYTYPQVMYASHVSVHLPTGTVCQPHASAPTHRYHVPPGDWLTEALCIIITTSDEILNLIQFMYMLVNVPSTPTGANMSHW